MNGIDCLMHLKNMEHLNDTKIFMYSTSEGAAKAESERLGAEGFIIKPSNIAELRGILSKIFA